MKSLKVFLGIWMLLWAVLVGAETSQPNSEKMVKIVWRLVVPEQPADSWEAKPRVLYRWGTTKGRTEEAADPEAKLQLVTIYNGKGDLWMINLFDKTGKHIIDPGPTYDFHSPIDSNTSSGKADLSFEFGSEKKYMLDHKAVVKDAIEDGKKVRYYEVVDKSISRRLYVSPDSDTPVGVAILDNGTETIRLAYDEYSNTLEPDAKLFQLPAGLKITEDKPNK